MAKAAVAKEPLTMEQRDLVSKHVRLAEKIAMKRCNPFVAPEDRIQDAYMGLINAARAFDPERGLEFSTYAGYRIIGAILDAERMNGSQIRANRKALKDKETPPKVVSFGSVKPGEDYEDEESLVSEDKLAAPKPTVTYDDVDAIETALASLQDRDRIIAKAWYAGGSQVAAARAAGVSESRVSQLMPGIIEKLRNHSALADYARGA